MTIRFWLRGLFFEPPMTVNVWDHVRRHRITDAEASAAADAGSKILRVSGQARNIPTRTLTAPVDYKRGTADR